MRKMQFAQHLDFVPASSAVTRGGPFTNAVHGQKCRLLIWRGKKCGGCMGLVMFRKKYPAIESAKFLADEFFHPNALANPERDSHQETSKTGRRICQIAVQNAIKLQEGFLVERDAVDIAELTRAFAKEVF